MGSSDRGRPIELPGPGSSWDAEPPKDTAVPVSDEMIETLVGGFPPESPEVGAPPDDIEAQLPVEQSDDHGADDFKRRSSSRPPWRSRPRPLNQTSTTC